MNIARTVRVVFTESGAVLQNTENGSTFGINHVGAAIWQHLANAATKDEIVDRLCSKFGVDRDQIRRDVDEFLAGLEQKGLLQKHSGNVQ
jgi:hypothetical protein